MLTTALNDHCRANDIPDGPERDDVARLIMVLFNNGMTNAEDLRAALDAAQDSGASQNCG